MKKLIFPGFIISLLLLLAFSGCLGGPKIPHPTSTPVSTPTSTATDFEGATPTLTCTPTNTSSATYTALATHTPTSTSTHTPTKTSTHTPSSTKTPTKTSTPTPTAAKTSTPTHTPTKTSTVTPITSPKLRIVNNSKYYMVDIRLNNVQQLAYPYVIEAGNYWDFSFTSGGTVDYYLGIGIYDNYGLPDVWFYLQGTTNVSAGNTKTVTFNLTLEQILSNFLASANWTGDYWVNTNYYYATLKFYSSGAWQLYDCGTLVGSGSSVIVTSWPDYSQIINFKLYSTGPTATIAFPFADFLYANGPPDWPTIEYVKK